MADNADDDLFADLYDGEDAEPEAPAPAAAAAPVKTEPDSTVTAPTSAAEAAAPQPDDDEPKPFDPAAEDMDVKQEAPVDTGFGGYSAPEPDRGPVHLKDDGKMFIGGLNWETTDQSLKDYFTQFGEVTECTVMRDGVTGRSRGFGFLTFKDPKVVNVVMVKEHLLDGKLIDPKRAIPRDEQEKTSKIFVGGVSQEATETDFRTFFSQFGNVLDCTLMMDKDTGRPRGFGFVTFDDDMAVERTLAQPLAIHGKPIEVKRAEPRGNLRDEGGGGRGGRFGGGGRGGMQGGGGFGAQQEQPAAAAGGNNMSPAMMAQYWQRMQQYFQMMQQNMQQQQNPMANPAMMQQMMAQMGRGGGGGQMNPQMMQQMAAMQGYPGGMQGSASPANSNNGGQQGFNAQEQLMFEQQKYERQQMARMQGGNFNGGGNQAWDGMYEDVPAPSGPRGGGFAGRGRGRGTPTAPAGAPTGPKNAGVPGSNYRGGGRGGRGRFEPYGRKGQ